MPPESRLLEDDDDARGCDSRRVGDAGTDAEPPRSGFARVCGFARVRADAEGADASPKGATIVSPGAAKNSTAEDRIREDSRASISRSSSASTRFASNAPSRRASRASLSRRASAAVASASASRATRDLAPVKLRTAARARRHADARGRPSRAAAAAAAAAEVSSLSRPRPAARRASRAAFAAARFAARSAAAASSKIWPTDSGGRRTHATSRGLAER